MPDWKKLRGWAKGVPSTSDHAQPQQQEFSGSILPQAKGQENGKAPLNPDHENLEENRGQVLDSPNPGSGTKEGANDPPTSSKELCENDSELFTTSQTPASTPPTMADIDRWTYHTDLQTFGHSLQEAVNAVFPNDRTSRYDDVSVLMISWADEDPQLPVSVEIDQLASVFEGVYHFKVEQWKIPDENCHFELAAKVMKFVEPDFGSERHLKIVYYAGHARLLDTRALALVRYGCAFTPLLRGSSFLDRESFTGLVLILIHAVGETRKMPDAL